MEEEKKVEPPKTKNGFGPGFMVILLVLFFIGIGLGFAASKLLDEPVKEGTTEEKESKEKKEEKKKDEVKEEELNVDSEPVTSLFENITNANTKYCGYYGLFTNKKTTANDISMEDRSLIMVNLLYKKLGDTEGKTYTKKEIDNLYKQLFGTNVSIQHGNVKSCPSLTYDSTKETYTVGEHACGGTCGPFSTYGQVKKAVKTGDTIVLDVRVIFADYNLQKWYADYDNTKEIQVPNDPETNGPDPSSVMDQATLYKVTFKLEDGNYVFVSTEPVK